MKKYTCLLVYIVAFTSSLLGQLTETNQQAKEEELIRYFGYEEVPSRYLSLPYDVTMSHNVEGNFMDIGYLLMCFIPLIFIWKVRSEFWRWVLALLLLFTTLISLGTSHMINQAGVKIDPGTEAFNSFINSPNAGILDKLVGALYTFAHRCYEPIGQLLERMISSGDHLTYVLLMAIVYMLYYLYRRFHTSTFEKYCLGLFLLFYCFFMWILSVGVIWYGFLMFPLLFLEIYRLYKWPTFYARLLLISTIAFVVLSYILKVSNVSKLDDKGIGMIHPPILDYNFGGKKGNEIYEGYYLNLGQGLDKINSETSSLVLLAGPSLKYFIDRNNERVYNDQLLNFTQSVIEEYKYKSKVNRALSSVGIKYIITSPNLYRMDRTPEKSLTKKYQSLLGYLYDNPGLELIATDRYVMKTHENGDKVGEFNLFGENVINPGTYAIYEIK